ncbi:IclR family transcriptional regulator [Hoeflea sp. WL0058]|uniref:IclR family transcriptional regulator n=1 Tax=Flavimaribacter sediminis TaxID=2865987 RepID=A0AAE3D1S9_9HYPH|nr:IclR family transcriptional regulator [Flavimaribacter sediminis]MBW8637868.1 IclR family transcriptional regulator [Flavimaribacter sediminis]
METRKKEPNVKLYTPLSRALRIVQLLAREKDGLPLSMIGQVMGLAKSATHRLLTTLQNDGYVMQDPISERYMLTLRFSALGFRYVGTMGLTDAAQPLLDGLAEKSGELVQLAIVDGDGLVWVAWSQGSSSPLRYEPKAGREVILHTTGAGACWLASLSDEDALKIIRRVGFSNPTTPGYGEHAVRDEEELLEKLRLTREQGYGVNFQEGEAGVNAIAVAVRNETMPDAPVVGSLAISGPAARTTEDFLVGLLPELQTTALHLSEIWPMRVQLLEGMHKANPGSK